MNAIKQWLTNHNISAHTVGLMIVSAYGWFMESSEAQHALASFLTTHPQYVLTVTTAFALWRNYAGSHSDKGKLAELSEASKAQIVAATKAVDASGDPAPPATAQLGATISKAAEK